MKQFGDATRVHLVSLGVDEGAAGGGDGGVVVEDVFVVVVFRVGLRGAAAFEEVVVVYVAEFFHGGMHGVEGGV